MIEATIVSKPLSEVQAGDSVLWYYYSSDPRVEVVERTTTTKVILPRGREYNRQGSELGKFASNRNRIHSYDAEVLAHFAKANEDNRRRNKIAHVNWRDVSDEQMIEVEIALRALGILKEQEDGQ
jgi:hypothetical protein